MFPPVPPLPPPPIPGGPGPQEAIGFSELALGHFMVIKPNHMQGGEYRFQNFWTNGLASFQNPITGTTSSYLFLPFGFSGVTVSRTGDNVDAGIVLPNVQLSRDFATSAIYDGWTAMIFTCKINQIDQPGGSPTVLYRNVGQVAGGTWDETEITMEVNSVLSAVGSEVPARTLRQRLVGDVPLSGQLNL